jgi:dTDP-4-dehydrorhamnose 3,5-epimerase-like enzyme
MVVAANADEAAYGSAEKTTKVKSKRNLWIPKLFGHGYYLHLK